MARNVIVLLDIDDTQLKQDREGAIEWMGGGASIWRDHLTALRAAGAMHGVIFHFGIGTFRKDKNDPVVIEVVKGLGELLKPVSDKKTDSNLLYTYTGDRTKVNKADFALEPAKQKIEADYKTTIDKKDVWIMDDLDQVNDDVTKAGYSCAQISGLTADSVNGQKEKIVNAFKKIFNAYNLVLSMPIIELYPADNKKPEDKAMRAKPLFTRTPSMEESIASASLFAASHAQRTGKVVTGLDFDDDETPSVVSTAVSFG